MLFIDLVAKGARYKIGLGGLASFTVWLAIALVSIIIAGASGLLRSLRPAGPPAYVPLRYRTPRRRRLLRLAAWIAFGFYFGSLTGLMLNAVIIGFEGGALYGLAMAVLPDWFRPLPSQASSFKAALKANHRNAVLTAVQNGVTAGIIFAIMAKLSLARLNMFVVGLNAALIFALAAAYGAGLGTWLQFRLNHAMLAVSRWLPWRLCVFLEDAHSRGVLRQAGTAWQFRHSLLQGYLADNAQQEHQRSSAGIDPLKYSWGIWLGRLNENRKNRIVLYKWSIRYK